MTAKKAAPAPAKKAPAKKTRSTGRRAPRKHDGPQATPAAKRVPGPITPPVSTAPKGFIVVDGSNVANSSRKDGKPRLENIRLVHDLLVHEGYEPVVFVDASLRHQIPDSEAKLFAKWEGDAFIVQVPRGVNGDEAVLEFASRRNAPVLSNDNYQDLETRYPWVRDRSRRIPYNLVRGELILYKYEEPPAPAEQTPAPAPASVPPPPARAPRVPEPPAAAPAARTAMTVSRDSPAVPSTGGQTEPPPEKHRNFRKPRQLVQQPTVPRRAPSRAEGIPDEEQAGSVAAPPPPTAQQRGRNGPIPRATAAEMQTLKQTLVQLFDAKVPPGGSIRADQLSEETRKAIPGFRPNYYGSSSFTKLLDRMDDVFELARRGPEGQMASLEGPQKWPIVVLRRG